jgi:hypothetical protein
METLEFPEPRPMTFPVWGHEETIDLGEEVRETGLVRLRGRDLREAALAVLMAHRGSAISVAEILMAFDDRGCEVIGPTPPKTLADALGHEVKKGRAVRTGRGVYALGVVPRTTGWRIRRRWGLRSWSGAQWHPRRAWRPTRYGRPPVPEALVRLIEQREGPGLAERLRSWTPPVLDVPLDPDETRPSEPYWH